MFLKFYLGSIIYFHNCLKKCKGNIYNIHGMQVKYFSTLGRQKFILIIFSHNKLHTHFMTIIAVVIIYGSLSTQLKKKKL